MPPKAGRVAPESNRVRRRMAQKKKMKDPAARVSKPAPRLLVLPKRGGRRLAAARHGAAASRARARRRRRRRPTQGPPRPSPPRTSPSAPRPSRGPKARPRGRDERHGLEAGRAPPEADAAKPATAHGSGQAGSGAAARAYGSSHTDPRDAGGGGQDGQPEDHGARSDAADEPQGHRRPHRGCAPR